MTADLELRLIGASVPDGEISLKDLAALSAALQELTTRIGRDVVQTPGPGRTWAFMEEFAQLRLRTVESGSTILRFGKGPIDKLDVSVAEHQLAESRFWEIIDAIDRDQRPEWASDLIAESTAKLIVALRDAAPQVSLSSSAHPAVKIDLLAVHSETWATRPQMTGTQSRARGRLEKVDLHSHIFRVRDDVGHSVELRHVVSDVEASHFIGQWVVAEGDGMVVSGRLVALDHAVISLLTDAFDLLGQGSPTSLDEVLASAPGPDPTAGIELTDEEFAAFLSAARA